MAMFRSSKWRNNYLTMTIQTDTCYVLIDLGGTHLRLAVWPSLTLPDDWTTKQFVLAHNFNADFNQLINNIEQQTSGRKIQAIGFASPGVMNESKTRLLRAGNLPEWIDQPIVERLSAKFNCPVFLDNDAVAAALGEVYYGGHHNEDFLLAIWGTGVGGAVMKQGATLQVEKTDHRKYLTALEDHCGGKAIVKKFGKPAAELNNEEWDQIIQEFLASIKQVGLTIGVSKIICGGGIAIKQKSRLQKLAAEIFDHRVSFQVSSLGTAESFGLYGAAALIQHNQ